ncbi:MAG TPA: response regulator transcription factor [Dyella sp.]|uniref:response regulator transcription factor n=1 Tax=Dyella sp. TaxID=1869338 RepID=UPI002F95FE07
MTSKPCILVAEHDDASRLSLGDPLARAGYRVDTAVDATAMWLRISRLHPAAVLLAGTLPGLDTRELSRRLQAYGQPPLIVLGTTDTPAERIAMLETGADDYLAKPVDPRELLARIQALLRRVQGHPATMEGMAALEFDGWRLDRRAARLTSPRGQRTPLGRTDHQVLCLLLQQANLEVSREYLTERVFQKRYQPTDRAIDMSVSRLRRHLHDSTQESPSIRTIRHIGYMLTVRSVRPADGGHEVRDS